MKKQLYERLRQEAALELIHRLELLGTPVKTAIILGTGWGGSFLFQATHTAQMAQIAAFQGLEVMEGHQRRFEIGTIELEDGRRERIIVLRGRIHMNESTFDPKIQALVRLQIDVLVELGIEKFLLTAAVGSLHEGIKPRSIVTIDAFPSYGQDVMPAFAGEFVTIEEALDRSMLDRLPYPRGPYIFFRGPHFENVLHDKPAMRALGGAVVGMSLKPEVFAVAAARQLRNMKTLRVVALGYVSNDHIQEMNDEDHRSRAKKDAVMLHAALLNTLDHWSS